MNQEKLNDLIRRKEEAQKRANDAYYDRNSSHYRDNIRFSWAIDAIDKAFEQERAKIMTDVFNETTTITEKYYE